MAPNTGSPESSHKAAGADGAALPDAGVERRRGRHGGRRTIPRSFALLFIFALPIAMMSVLFLAITTYSSMASPMADAPRVGAGAGRTGMLNEYRGIGSDGRSDDGEAPDPASGPVITPPDQPATSSDRVPSAPAAPDPEQPDAERERDPGAPSPN